jgi:hypothetical protein
MPDPGSIDPIVTIVKIGFLVVGSLFVFAIIRGIIYGQKRRKVLRDAGLDPMVASVQMEARLANSALLSPASPAGPTPAAKTVEERLADLESLHERGLISAEELHEARAKVLAG